MHIYAISPAVEKDKDPYAKKKEVNYQLLLPLLYAPVLPLIRIGLRGRIPQRQIDFIFGAAVLTALGHAGYVRRPEMGASVGLNLRSLINSLCKRSFVQTYLFFFKKNNHVIPQSHTTQIHHESRLLRVGAHRAMGLGRKEHICVSCKVIKMRANI